MNILPLRGVLAAAVLIVAAMGFAPTLPAQTTVFVSTSAELRNAVNSANSSGGNRTIVLADGVYTLNDTLYVNASGITLTGQSQDREKVVIQGDAMSPNAAVGNVIRVAGSNFELSHITVQRGRWHAIQVVGENRANNVVIRDCILRDTYEQLLKVSIDQNDLSRTSDFGVVENCLFEYSAGIGPQWYIGGIDAHGSKNWIVRGNVFRYIASPGDRIAQFAIHFWNASANNLVERNVIIDSDRGIGFGLDNRPNNGGIIRNNMVYHSGQVGSFHSAGISLVESPNAQVYNNTVFLNNNASWAIDYRFPSTVNVLVRNNLTNKSISSRDGASGSVGNNVVNAQSGWFVQPSSGNLRLSSSVASVVNQGVAIDGLVDDIDGNPRPQGGGFDIGAHEYGAISPPSPPQGLTVH